MNVNTMKEVDLGSLGPSELHKPMFERLLNHGEIAEEDFNVFSLFRGRETLLIDVGANLGAASLAALNLCETIDTIAFEPNISLIWFLKQVEDVYRNRGRKYQLIMSGLGDTRGRIDFYIPRVGDWYVVGEASMLPAVFESEQSKKRLSSYSGSGLFEIHKTQVSVEVFDNIDLPVLGDKKYDFFIIKIDVETFEAHVIRGMQKLLSNKLPLIYMENSSIEAREALQRLGYQSYEYEPKSSNLVRTNNLTRINTCYMHPNTPFPAPERVVKFA